MKSKIQNLKSKIVCLLALALAICTASAVKFSELSDAGGLTPDDNAVIPIVSGTSNYKLSIAKVAAWGLSGTNTFATLSGTNLAVSGSNGLRLTQSGTTTLTGSGGTLVINGGSVSVTGSGSGFVMTSTNGIVLNGTNYTPKVSGTTLTFTTP